MQPEKFTPETKIRLLLALINDEGYNKFDAGFNKLLLRLNEFYDSNFADIRKYLSQAIINVPLKAEIYAKVLRKLNKKTLTNEIFHEVTEEMKKSKNAFVHFRCFKFFIYSVIYGLVPKENFVNYVNTMITNKNKNVIKLLIRSFAVILDNTEKTSFLIEISEKINSSGLITDSLWEMIYSTISNKNGKKDEIMQKICKLKIQPDIEDPVEGEIINPFSLIEKITYEHIYFDSIFALCEGDVQISYENYHYRLIQIDIISSLKDNFSLCEKYLFNISSFYDCDTAIQSAMTLMLPETLLILALSPIAFSPEVTLIASLTVSIIKHFGNLESIFNSFITNYLAKAKTLDSLSAYQIQNLVIYVTFYASNIPNSKSGILNVIIDSSLSNENYFYGKCLCDKMTNLITKSTFEQITKNYDDTFLKDISTEPKSINTSSDFAIMAENIKLKQKFEDFKSKLSNKDITSNELLINFIQCILIHRSKTLSHLRETFALYADTIREMESTNRDEKEYILLNSIFNVWGHSTTHLLFIIELLYNKYLLGHLNVIKFIFGEKLNQSKSNVLDWVYYDIIDLTMHNCGFLLEKVKRELKAEQTNLAKSEEDQRINIINKIEMYEEIEKRLLHEKDILYKDIISKFVSLNESAERLGGNELKLFIERLINDFTRRCLINSATPQEEEK